MCPPHGEGRLSKCAFAMMPLLKVHMKASSSKELKRVGSRLYSYVVTHDTGFSPNPFFGYCTLACCKPSIRRSAKLGDWIVGLTPKSLGSRVVYFMRIDYILPTFDAYWRDRRFARKKPLLRDDIPTRCGDNIYEPTEDGKYRQHGKVHSSKDIKRDLGGQRILVSETFTYFGSKAVKLPPHLSFLVVGRAHKCRFTAEQKNDFNAFVAGLGTKGNYAPPRKWPTGNDSWLTKSPSSCSH
jgi:hypothetical protein